MYPNLELVSHSENNNSLSQKLKKNKKEEKHVEIIEYEETV